MQPDHSPFTAARSLACQARQATPRHAHAVRRRIWQATGLFGVIVLSLVLCDASARWNSPDPKLNLGHDLLPSYAAGVLVRTGHAQLMYDRDAISAVEVKVIHDANLDIVRRYGAWLNPPFFAWAFAPLSALPYRAAAAVFLGVNLVLLALSLTLLTRMMIPREPLDIGTAPPDWRTYALVPVLTILPVPFWQAMGHQQNTFISLFLLASAIACWRGGKAFTAGLIAGLLFFKPQLAVLVSLALIIGTGWRALAGLAITGSALLLVTLVSMPGCLHEFLYRLPPILHWLQNEQLYNWRRQVTLQSFWRLLIQGSTTGETALLVKALWWTCSAALFLWMALAARRFYRSSRDATSRDRFIAAAVMSMPMLMPYYMDYDMLLLSVPAVLFAAEWARKPAGITRADWALMIVWAIACVVMSDTLVGIFWTVFSNLAHLSPGIVQTIGAIGSRFNPTALLLATLSVLHLSRCLRPPQPQAAMQTSALPPRMAA